MPGHSRVRAPRRARVGSAALAAVLAITLGTAGGSAGADPVPDPAGDSGWSDSRLAAAARALGRSDRSGLSGAGGVSGQVVSGVGTIAETDPVGDAPDQADITAVSATMHTGRARFSATLPTTPDPTTDEAWQEGLSFVAALIDVNGDDAPDYDAFMLAAGDRWIGGVITDDGEDYLCNLNAAYNPATDVFSMTIPLRCIGTPSTIDFVMGSQYDVDPFDDSLDDALNDFAPDGVSLELSAALIAPRLGGGFLLEGGGRVRPFTVGTAAPSARVDDVFPFDIARGISSTPDGGHAYVVDGYGGLHAVGFAGNVSAARVYGGPYWPGWDIARGLGIVASGRSGFVVDGYGGLHGFGIGQARPVPIVVGGSYWSGWDIARGVAFLPNGTGGFVVDGFGGLHWFSLKSARPAPAIVGNAYWPGQDRARGVTIFPDGRGGYVVDSAGRLHRFGIGAPSTVSTPATPALPTRGVTVLPRALGLPRPAPAPA